MWVDGKHINKAHAALTAELQWCGTVRVSATAVYIDIYEIQYAVRSTLHVLRSKDYSCTAVSVTCK